MQQEYIPMDGLNVPEDADENGYRVTIPKHVRDEFGIEAGSFVTLRIVDDDRSARFNTTVNKDGRRVTIPSRLREDWGVEPGGTVDLEYVV